MVKRLEKAQIIQKQNFDRRRKEARILKVGDMVLAKISSIVSSGNNRKLLTKYKGPFRVVQVLENDRYKEKNMVKDGKRRKNYEGIYGI